MTAANIGDRPSESWMDGPRPTWGVAAISMVVLAGSYVVNSMDRQVFPVLLPGIRGEYAFNLGQGGLLATIFTLGIGVAGVPTGYLLDRFSRKSVMLLGIVIFSVFTILTTIATGFADMFVYRAATGVGEAMQNSALFAAVGAYFFANRALALGTFNCAYGLGGFLGPLLGGKIAAAGGWRAPLWTYGIAGVAFVALVAVVIRKSFTERRGNVDGTGPRLRTDQVPSRLYNRNILLLGLTAAVVGISMYGYIGLYPTFLTSQLHLSSGQASLAASMFGLGALLGIPAGWLGDRLNPRAVMLVALVVGSLIGYLLFNGPTTAGPQYVLSFAEGAVASGFLYVNIYSAMQRSVLPHLIGRASGLYVGAFYVPAALAGYLFAAFVGATGWGGAGLWQLTVLPLIGVVAMVFVDPARMSRPVVGTSRKETPA